MSRQRSYHHQGSLTQVLLALVARAGSLGDDYLSVVCNDHCHYYGLVDDSFLNDNQSHPEDKHMRLLLRINDAELQIFHDTFEILQGDLFDNASPTLPETQS